MKLALDPLNQIVAPAVDRILGVEQLPPFSVALALQRLQRPLSLQFVFKQSGERRRFPRLADLAVEFSFGSDPGNLLIFKHICPQERYFLALSPSFYGQN